MRGKHPRDDLSDKRPSFVLLVTSNLFGLDVADRYFPDVCVDRFFVVDAYSLTKNERKIRSAEP